MSLKNFIPFMVALGFSINVLAADDNIVLQGRVKDNLTKFDLTNSMVLFYDVSGNVTDTIRANQGLTWRDGKVDTLAYFSFKVPRTDSIYVFDVVCDGYQTKTVSFPVAKVGKRENYREIPVVFLSKEMRRNLDEVTVVQSKIKFYNKGDTVVYDASAFQLAEGSMLDALIAQLPGVELSTDGQIKVNGEFVESLLLNGRQFFDGNNNLMLENIAAYSVKDIQVYQGVRKEDEIMGKVPQKILTMDVRMKKDYQIGWLLNAQGGGGTKERYLGRLFAAWFNPEWNVGIIGNVNNLNDNRTPGRNDTWTPEQMPSGRVEYRTAGVNYSFIKANDRTRANGNVMFSQTVNKTETTTSRTNFLPGGDTYDRAFRFLDNNSYNLNTRHWLSQKVKNVWLATTLEGSYSKLKNASSSLSGTFSTDQDTMTYKVLDAIYSDASGSALQSILNRAKTMDNTDSRTLYGKINPNISYVLPGSGDRLSLNFMIQHRRRKEDMWQEYDINYGPTTENAQQLRQYFDNNPYRKTDFFSILTYSATVKKRIYLALSYRFGYTNERKDSYMYALDRLADMGVYGVLPPGYQAAFDPSNSYTSHQWGYSHGIQPALQGSFNFNDGSALVFNVSPVVTFYKQKFSYWRNNTDYSFTKNFIYTQIAGWYYGYMEYYFDRSKNSSGRNTSWRNTLRYSYTISNTLPELLDQVDVVNDADPLNIYIGNPDLKVSFTHSHQLRWGYDPESYTFNNYLTASYNYVHNALTRGYTYDTGTGVRVNKMYNIDGNHGYGLRDELQWQFGSRKQFTLSNSLSWNKEWLGDMIGIDMEEPQLTKVRNSNITDGFKLAWQLGNQSIGLRCDVSNRRTRSSQQGFNNLNATHVNAGVQGVFKLPAGFGLSTDFTFYTRRGYGVEYLDTTDPIWNLRITYAPPRNSHWVITLDGFDMLHQLSNVNYAVTASGRTVTYTNTLPRYFILTAQYRLNIQPKKK